MIDCELFLLEPCACKAREQRWSKLTIDCELFLLEPCARKAPDKQWSSWTRPSKLIIDCELISLQPCARLYDGHEQHDEAARDRL